MVLHHQDLVNYFFLNKKKKKRSYQLQLAWQSLNLLHNIWVVHIVLGYVCIKIELLHNYVYSHRITEWCYFWLYNTNKPMCISRTNLNYNLNNG